MLRNLFYRIGPNDYLLSILTLHGKHKCDQSKQTSNQLNIFTVINKGIAKTCLCNVNVFIVNFDQIFNIILLFSL